MVAMTHERFGRLTALARRDGGKLLCVCDCGGFKVALQENLRAGRTQSCGCLRIAAATSHGASGTPTYSSWRSEISRCTNPRDPSYFYYGGIGVRFHVPWLIYENFLADMGERPQATSLDRINPAGNYEPGNCRWASASLQARNTRKVPLLIDTPAGPLRMCEAVEVSGIPRINLAARIRLGWPASRLFAPVTPNPHRNKEAA